MELHTFELMPPVPYSHDDPVFGLRRNGQLLRQRSLLHDQRVVARGDKRLRQVLKYALAVMMNLTGLAMKQSRCTHNLSAIRRTQRLMPQAYPQDREPSSQSLNQLN